MKITQMKTNRIDNPLGFDLGKPRLSYKVIETVATKQAAAQIQVFSDEKGEQLIFDTGRSEQIDSLAFELPILLKPRTRYYWRVTVWADNGETATSEIVWFETGKLEEKWKATWITPELEPDIHPILSKNFSVDSEVRSARAYVCGLGLYEMELNGRKAGNEYLTPNFNAYDKWLQVQTYDLTDLIEPGPNLVELTLGNGLYKGRFGFDGGESNFYGDRYAALCEIVITYMDGTITTVQTDETWQARRSSIMASSLYDGEVFDATFEDMSRNGVTVADLGYDKLKSRLSPPVVIQERLKPVEVIKTPAGETVLDLGQNMVGWIEFTNRAPQGTEIVLQYGELLQDGNFYRDNLGTAKAEYRYISNGSVSMVRPHFTFYGFRYVKVSGWCGDLDSEDFTGCVLYSDIEVTGNIETSNPLVNRLFQNAMWGQKGNFLDVPTDCPQRDERMGWTGDAQVFAGTASFNMDTYAFFSKYGYDLWKEQEAADGRVPMVVPAFNLKGGGSSAWGDAATIIPWTVYLHYGDKAILEQQFDSMKSWVDYIKKADDESGSRRLWTVGFHFGDWLALDGEDPSMPSGGTDTAFIASAYYCYSSGIVAKAARVLGKEELAKDYEALSNQVREAIRMEYFTPTGRLALNNQTALVLALFMDLAPERDRRRVAKDLRDRLRKDNNHLKTGFVGTPYLCRVLSDSGHPDLAYTLLLNKDYPSWLYAVKLGATTIWERWNSVLPDGRISGSHMNSLNHYAYGSILEWMYRHMAGINPIEEQPGFKQVRMAPQPDYRLEFVKASLNSAAGRYESEWRLKEDGGLWFRFAIPFDATATVELPDALIENVAANGKSLKDAGLPSEQDGSAVHVRLTSGTYEFEYTPSVDYIKRCSVDMPLNDLLKQDEARAVITNVYPHLADISPNLGIKSMPELIHMPFLKLTAETIEAMGPKLQQIKLSVQ